MQIIRITLRFVVANKSFQRNIAFYIKTEFNNIRQVA